MMNTISNTQNYFGRGGTTHATIQCRLCHRIAEFVRDVCGEVEKGKKTVGWRVS